MRIRGTTAIVTGASSGIGRSVALALARKGARVALIARREAALLEVAVAVEKQGGQALVVPCDVGDPQAVAHAMASVATAWGGPEGRGAPDILVNAAGCAIWRRFLAIAEPDHRRMMDTNYWGTFHWIRAVLPGMVERRRGSIVNISAGSGKFALAVTSGFSASKFAVAGLSEALRRELAGSGVQVCAVFPGSVKTPFWNPDSIATELLPPLVRYAPKLSPEAVARGVCLAIWLGLAERTLPFFVGFLARVNSLWSRAGDFLLWRWAFPTLAALWLLRYLLRS